MKLRFEKMQGLGNDMVVILCDEKFILSSAVIRQLADRHYGVGCDQLLLVSESDHKGIDYTVRIFNADGSMATQCGNGMRCVARYLFENGWVTRKSIWLQTASTIINAVIEDDGDVSVNMGLATIKNITIAQKNAWFIDMGNPHIIFLEHDDDKIVHFIMNQPEWSEGVNIGFASIIRKNFLKLRTFERGVGFTLACGSNDCAAVVAGIYAKRLENTTITVKMTGGDLKISWQGQPYDPVWMKGSALSVFSGVLSLTKDVE